MAEETPSLPTQEKEAIAFYYGLARKVAQGIGPGRCERVYHNALSVLLTENKIPHESEEQFAIKFESPDTRLQYVVGNERLDVRTLGGAGIILELKAVAKIDDAAVVQLVHYMNRAGSPPIGAVVNYGLKQFQFVAVFHRLGQFYTYDPVTEIVLLAPRHTYLF